MIALRALKGVGPGIERRLKSAGIVDAHTLVMLKPRTYRDWRSPSSIASVASQALAAVEGEDSTEVILIGEVVKVDRFRGRVSIVRAELADGSGRCDAVWFARGRERVQLEPGMRLFIQGRVKLQRRGNALRTEVAVLDHRVLAADQPYNGRIWPVYPATKELPSRVTAKAIEQNLDELLTLIGEEHLPPELAQRRRFPTPPCRMARITSADRPAGARTRAGTTGLRYVFRARVRSGRTSRRSHACRRRDRDAGGAAIA